MRNRITFFLLISFIACTSNDKLSNYGFDEILEKDYYENGTIKKVLFKNKNSYIGLEFSNTGRLIDSIPYNLNNQIHGLRKYFTDDRIPFYSYINYLNGVQEGKSYGKYLNGKTIFKGQYANDIKIDSWHSYDTLGQLSSYRLYNFLGELVYVRTYKNGKLINSKGDGIGYLIYESDTIKKGEQFKMKITFASPPNCIVEVAVAESLTESNEPTGEFYQYALNEKGQVFYTATINKAGKYKKGIAWALSDSLNNTKEKDFDIFEIVVKE